MINYNLYTSNSGITTHIQLLLQTLWVISPVVILLKEYRCMMYQVKIIKQGNEEEVINLMRCTQLRLESDFAGNRTRMSINR